MEEQQLDLEFPFFGVDISQGPFVQRPGTSPLGVNVRGYATDFRKRGGSRPGLNPWFGAGSTEQVEGFAKIQSLSSIVWVTPAATFNSAAVQVIGIIDYAETDHPPARSAPSLMKSITWYEGTSPNRTIVTGVVVGTPDGGGTGQGTAKFLIQLVGSNVVITGTFISAGFPPPVGGYAFVGHPETFSIQRPTSSFFSGGVLNDFWTVADFVHGFVAQYSFSFTGSP